MNDEEHVRSAISYFHKCPKDKQKSLAQKIVKAAKKFGVEISEKSKVMKALNESEVDFEELRNIQDPNKRLRRARQLVFMVDADEEDELNDIIDSAIEELKPEWLARKQKVMGDHLTRQGY